MSSRCATKHGQIRLRKSRKSEACLGKSQTTEEPTVKWCAVEVCGFGVPLPRSNLLAARVSKSCCNRPNVGCLDLLCKRFMNIFKRAVTIPPTEHDFLWLHSAAQPGEAKTPAVKQVGTVGNGYRQERYHLTLWPTNAGVRRPTLAPPPFLRRSQARAVAISGGATAEPLPAQAAGSATTAQCLRIALH